MAAAANRRWGVRAELLGTALLAIPVTAFALSRGQVLRGLGAGGAIVFFATLLYLEMRRHLAVPRRPPVENPLWLGGLLDAVLLGFLAVLDTRLLLRDQQPGLAVLSALGETLIVASAVVVFAGWAGRRSAHRC